MTSIGLMFAVGILVYGFAAPASGWLSDRLGRIQVAKVVCRVTCQCGVPLVCANCDSRQIMGVGLVMLGASMPLLVLPSTLTGVGAALCFMGVSCALAVTGTLPQVLRRFLFLNDLCMDSQSTA